VAAEVGPTPGWVVTIGIGLLFVDVASAALMDALTSAVAGETKLA
jgi:uncharacterized membrane protein